MVIRGGENISSIEVEAALFEHPAVLEAAVFPVPHEVLGEEVGAVVQLRADASTTSDELRVHAAALIAPFKVPAHIWIQDAPLPRGPTGKIQKRELRAKFTTDAASPDTKGRSEDVSDPTAGTHQPPRW